MLEDFLRSPRNLYYALPQRYKRLIGGAYALFPDGVRLGPGYSEFVKLIDETEFMSRSEIEELQYNLLRQTLSVGYEHVPYYQRVFAEYGVTPRSLTCPADIAKFPLLTKQDIQTCFSDLIATDVPRWKHLPTTTGGSTAAPLKLIQVKGRTRSKERAFIWDGWSRVGYFPRARTVQLKGRTVGDPAKRIFWEYEPIQNFLEMDGNYLTRDNIPLYLAQIRDFKPLFLLGYPSAIYLLAMFLQQEPKMNPFAGLRAVLLASENVYPWQRALFEEVFGCRVFSHYGHSEMVLLGMEGEQSRDLLFFPQYGYLEMLDENDNPVNAEGKYGELVGTSFHNEAMPLIRYRTQDYGVVGSSPDSLGRYYPTLKGVEGRLQEFIVTSDKRLVSIVIMGAAHFNISRYVYETQYYQDAPGHVEFHVVPREEYNTAHRDAIYKTLKEKLGDAVSVEIKEVPELKKSRTGKHIMLIQKLPIDDIIGYSDSRFSDHSLGAGLAL